MTSFLLKTKCKLGRKKKNLMDLAWKAKLNPAGLIKDSVVTTAKNPVAVGSVVAGKAAVPVGAVIGGPTGAVVSSTPISLAGPMAERALKRKFPKYKAVTEKIGNRLENSKTLDKIANGTVAAGKAFKTSLGMFSSHEEVIHGKDWAEVIKSKNTKHSKRKDTGFVLHKPGLDITSSSSSLSYTNYD